MVTVFEELTTKHTNHTKGHEKKVCRFRMVLDINEDKDGFTLTVRVVPRSSRSEIVGEIEGAVKVRLSSPPVDGAANVELIRLISKTLGVSKSSVSIVSGETSKTKRLRVAGVSAQKLRDVLAG